ncbi:DUF3667 domain-containing protein [Pinirhizobacter soli]|uniref:DUF3667 domain-containing protein n=1 Tax=Pinirhizobacter soli TaxID=2786953 RepID=UPI002029D7FA|nr:DUF3667 domain-containing protein [Pinirhizobacter soli]
MSAPMEDPGHAVLDKECLNCGANLHGRYCSDCGQSSDDHKRPILHLLREGLEGLVHLDGRLIRTLPLLFFRPGQLARDHMDGRRMRHVPPFRLFLVSLFLFMLSMEVAVHGMPHGHGMTITVHEGPVTRVVEATPSQMADILSGEKTPEQIANGVGVASPSAGRETQAGPNEHFWSDPRSWTRGRLQRALSNPEYFELLVFTWAHRLAILLLPIFAVELMLLYSRHRQFYAYDHLVVSMQFLAFVFLVTGLAWLAPGPLRGAAIFGAAVWVPVNLHGLLRGAYGSGFAGALTRTIGLWLSTQIVFIVLVVGLLAFGLQLL